jgi:hypothetical protein
VAANLALRCSAIFSFSAFREAPGPTDFEKEAVLVCDEAIEALGLLGSFSSAVFSRLSSVSNILLTMLANISVLCLTKLTSKPFEAIPKQTSSSRFGMPRGLWG